MATHESLEPVKPWRRDRKNTTNAERLGREPTQKEMAAQRWREKNISSVKTNTVKTENDGINVSDVSLQFLEAWNEYCSTMESLEENVFKSFFKNSVEAGKRVRISLRRQKKLIALMMQTSLQYEHFINEKRKQEKAKTKKKAKAAATSAKETKFVLVEQTAQ